MKKCLLSLAALMLATAAHGADGDTFSYDGLNYEVLSEADGTAMVIGQNGEVAGNLVIPSSVVYGNSGYDVAIINYNAFVGCGNLISVVLPGTVTEIRERAFSDCSGLTELSLPESLTTIGGYAFAGCSSLTSVAIPASVTDISRAPFLGCVGLMEISVAEGNRNFCSENGALYDIQKSALIQWPGGKTECVLPDVVTEIAASAFSGCSGLTSVALPASLTKIKASAFSDCSSLTSVVIPESVTSIGDDLFLNCVNLNSVVLPSNLAEISMAAFFGCEKLTKITDLNPSPQMVGGYAFSGVPADAVVYVPKGSKEAYMTAAGWSVFTDFREMGAFDVALSADALELQTGKSDEITATVVKDDDVIVESTEWSSSDPDVAIVMGGVVTAIAPGTAVITYSVYDGYGVEHVASCIVTVSGNSAVGSVATEQADALVDVYTMQGLLVLCKVASSDISNLSTGVYIVRQGSAVKKIAVR